MASENFAEVEETQAVDRREVHAANSTKLILQAALYQQGETYFVEVEKNGEDLRRQEIPAEHVPMIEMVLSQL